MNIQRADPDARRRAIILAIALLVLFMLALAALRLLDADRMADAVASRPMLLPATGLVLMAPICLFAIYTCRKGGQVVRQRRFPIPGERIIRDTAIREGSAAVRTGRIMQLLSIALIVCALGVPWLLWRLAETFVING